LPETSLLEHDAAKAGVHPDNGQTRSVFIRSSDSTSLRALVEILSRRRRLALCILGGLLLACLFYCLLAPREYEARARVSLLTAPASSLTLDGAEPKAPSSETAAMVQTETIAGILRSDRLAWQVILDRKLYAARAVMGGFPARFPGFRPEAPAPDAQACLLERFQDRLQVGTMPRTLLVEIRFHAGNRIDVTADRAAYAFPVRSHRAPRSTRVAKYSRRSVFTLFAH